MNNNFQKNHILKRNRLKTCVGRYQSTIYSTLQSSVGLDISFFTKSITKPGRLRKLSSFLFLNKIFTLNIKSVALKKFWSSSRLENQVNRKVWSHIIFADHDQSAPPRHPRTAISSAASSLCRSKFRNSRSGVDFSAKKIFPALLATLYEWNAWILSADMVDCWNVDEFVCETMLHACASRDKCVDSKNNHFYKKVWCSIKNWKKMIWSFFDEYFQIFEVI